VIIPPVSSQLGEGSHVTAVSAWVGSPEKERALWSGSLPIPSIYYTFSSNFSTGVTQVTFTGNQFAEIIETAVLEFEKKVKILS
jgi:hypothetical protein